MSLLGRGTLPKAPSFVSPLIVGRATTPAETVSGEPRLARQDRS